MPYRDIAPPEGWVPRRARARPGADWDEGNWPESRLDAMATRRKGKLRKRFCLRVTDIADLWFEPEPGAWTDRGPQTAKRYSLRKAEQRAWKIYGGPMGLAAEKEARENSRRVREARRGRAGNPVVPRGRGRGRGAGPGRGRNRALVPQAPPRNGQPAQVNAQAAPQARVRRRGRQIEHHRQHGPPDPAAPPAGLMLVQAPDAGAAPVVRNAPRPNIGVLANVPDSDHSDSNSDSDVEIVGEGPAPPTPSRSQKQARRGNRSNSNAQAGPSRPRIYAKEEVEVVSVRNAVAGPSTPVKVKSQPPSRRDPRVGSSGLLTPPPTERSANRVSGRKIIEIESASEADSKAAKRRRTDTPATPTPKRKAKVLDIIDLSFD